MSRFEQEPEIEGFLASVGVRPLRPRGWRKVLLGALAASVVVTPTLAAEESEEDATPSSSLTERIVVTASRLEVPLSESSASVTVLDEEEIAASAAQTVDDLLRSVPGFSLFRRSSSITSHPTSQGVSLRGIGPSGVSRTLVLLDGVPLNDPFGGWIYWSRVPKLQLERVEVMRGGGSNIWGNFALGGVIDLTTRRGSSIDTLRLDASAFGGNHSTYGAEASLAGRRATGGFTLYGDFYDTDGYRVVSDEQAGTIDTPAYSEHDSLGVTGELQPSSSVELFARVGVFSEERGNGTALTGNDTESTNVALGGSFVTAGGSWHARVFADDQDFGNLFSAQAADRLSERPALSQEVTSEAFGASLQWIRNAGRHTLSAGGDWRATEGETNEFFFFSGGTFLRNRLAGGDHEVGGVYFQDVVEVAERVTLQLGARVDQWTTADGSRLETNISDGAIRLDEVYEDRDETTFSPKVALVFEASDRSRLRASAYRSFRAPTVNELFRPFRVRSDITAANALLDPETLFGLELGWSYFAPAASASVTLFHNEIDDPIANVTIGFGPGFVVPCGFTPGGGSCRQRQNLGESRVRGLEAELRFDLSDRFRLSVSGITSDTEIVTAPDAVFLEGLEIAQVPDTQSRLRLDYLGRGGFTAGVELRMAASQFEDDLNERQLDSYEVLDLSAAYALGSTVSLFAGVENVFDDEVDAGLASNGILTLGAPRRIHGGVRIRPGAD